MRIGLVAGSSREGGSTQLFLRQLQTIWTQADAPTREGTAFAKTEDAVNTPGLYFVDGPHLEDLPLFSSGRLANGVPEGVRIWATFVKTADLLVVATPEYAHGVPAALKSALEWLVASGEFSRKRCLPFVVAPHAPRGEHCMQALVWTLQAMDADVVAEVPVYATTEQLKAPEDQEWSELTKAAYELVAAAGVG